MDLKMECKRCGYETKHKCDLIRHLRRKYTCPVIKEDIPVKSLLDELIEVKLEGTKYQCDKCKKYFPSRQSKYQHKKHCKEPIIEQSCEQFKDKVEFTLEMIEKMVEEKLSLLTKNMNVTNNINNNANNNTNNGVININYNSPSVKGLRNFGHENMDAIPLDLIRSTFMNLEFRTLFENLHCDPDYPENHNVRIKSIKRDMVEIYDDDKWKTFSSLIAFKRVIDQLYKIYREFKKNHKKEILEDMDEVDFLENESKLEEVLNWMHDNNSKMKQCSHAKDIEAALDENRKMLMVV